MSGALRRRWGKHPSVPQEARRCAEQGSNDLISVLGDTMRLLLCCLILCLTACAMPPSPEVPVVPDATAISIPTPVMLPSPPLACVDVALLPSRSAQVPVGAP